MTAMSVARTGGDVWHACHENQVCHYDVADSQLVYAHDVERNSVHHCCYELRNSLTIGYRYTVPHETISLQVRRLIRTKDLRQDK